MQEKLGEGVYSTVYRAERDGETYALKLQKPTDREDNEEVQRRFVREAATLARLDNPALPYVWTVDEVDGRMYLVMDYIEGVSLSELDDDESLEASDLARIGRDICSALGELHGAGLVHRDIKPSNIIWDGERAYLVDFGLVGIAVEQLEDATEGAVVGTLAYASPEQLRALKRPVDARSDLYSLGAVLYDVVSGAPPHDHAELDRLLRAHAADEPASLEEVSNSSIDADVREIIERLIAKEPSVRYQSATAAAEAFEAQLEQLDPGATADDDDKSQRVGDLQTILAKIGRREELERLGRAWSYYRQVPNGICTLVSGREGLGREELVTQALDDIEDAELILRTDRDASEESRPLEAISDLFAGFLHPTGERSSADARLATLNRAVDAIPASQPVRRFVHRVTGDSADDRSPTPSLQTHQFIGELARLLGAVASEYSPAVVALDRAESLDYTSSMVVRRLSHLLAQFDIFLLVSVDPDASTDQSLYSSIRGELAFLDDAYDDPGSSPGPDREHPSGIEVAISPLSTEDVKEYLSAYLNTEFTETDFADQLRAASGGSPVILRQLVEALIERRVVRPDWDGWEIDRDRWQVIDIPTNTRDLLASRLDNIDAEMLELCCAAAVWGHSFPLEPIAEALDWSKRHLARTAERASLHDLFVEAPGDDDFKFVHTSVRNSLLERTPDQRKRQLHQRYAEWLDSNQPDEGRTEWSFTLAWHYAHGDDSRPSRTFESCWKAGRRAADNFAFDRTLTFLKAAKRGADAADIVPPPELLHLLAWTHAELGHFDDADELFGRAIRRAESPLDEARYLIRRADIHAARLEVEPVETGIRRALELLNEPAPVSGLGAALWLAPRFVQNHWWQRRQSYPETDSDEQLILRLRSRAYDLLGLAAVFSEKDLLSLCAEIGRMHTALQLGPSPELARAYSSSATLQALLGRASAARRQIERGNDISETIDSAYAQLRVELAETWTAHILGDPVTAAEQATPILNFRADQLSMLDRSFALEEIAVNFGLRGFSEKVREWFQHWYSLHEVRSDRWPPGTLYSTALVHARLRGNDDFADELREVSRDSVDQRDRSIYFRKSHLSAVTFDNVLLEEPPEIVEASLRERLELGSDPGETVFWAKTFFIYAAYTRRYLADHPETDDREERLEALEIAVQRLESAAKGHPTLRAHANVLRGALAHRRSDIDTAFEFLSDAERLAIEHRNQWVLFEVSRERARLLSAWYPAQESSSVAAGRIAPRHRQHARDAVDVAEQLGWQPRAKTVRDEFDLSHTSTATTGNRPSSPTANRDTASSVSTRQIELQRKLDALLDVSMATSSIIDPDEVSEVVVDAAIRVLGAERGLLFLTGEDSVLEQHEPRVIRTSHESDDTRADDEFDSSTFSRTVLEQVASTREAVVVRGTREGADIGAESIVTHNIRSVIAAPLIFDERMVGAIYLDNRLAGGVFDESDVEVLKAIANHIPVALETARTAQLEVEVATERERRAYAETLRNFTQDVNGMLDVSEILAHLLDHLSQSLDLVEAWGLRLPDNGSPAIHVHYADERLHTDHVDAESEESLPAPGEIVTSVAENQSVHTISPVQDDDRQREPFISESTQSWVAIPLGTGRRPIGVAILASDSSDAFPPVEIEQALAFADQAGIAVEKAILANNDPLTGVYNRRKFFDIAEREFERCKREEKPLSALLLDVDNFKSINDRHGHAAGDTALEHLADICERSVRRYDTIARYGGEEFAILLPATPLDEARESVAARIRENIEQTDIPIDETAISVTVSIGVASRDGDEDDPHALLERADDAMYLAKRRGKNRVATYDDIDQSS